MLALFEDVSKAASPGSLESSLTPKRKALFAPVSEFTTREKVPSPLSITVAFTPLTALNAVARPDKVLLLSEITTD